MDKPGPVTNAVLRALDWFCCFMCRFDNDAAESIHDLSHGIFIGICAWRDAEERWVRKAPEDPGLRA